MPPADVDAAMPHRPVLLAVPGRVQVQSYGPADVATPELVERIVGWIEAAAGTRLTHSIRSTFPALLRHTIADEARAVWASAPRRRLRLSNRLSDPEHVELGVHVAQRRGPDGPVPYGSQVNLT